MTFRFFPCLLPIFLSLTALSAPPIWWADRGVTNASPQQNKGVANLGQAKNMANQAHSELEALLISGAGYSQPFNAPANPDAAWYITQKKSLNLGQLKAVAKPFYDRLNAISPSWVETQLQANGLTVSGTDYFQDATSGYFYPWNPTTPIEENFKVATIGQLKLVFSMRLREDKDNANAGDGLPDIWEWQIVNSSPGGVINSPDEVIPEEDFDSDGVSNSDEYQNNTDPLDIYSGGGAVAWPSSALIAWYRMDEHPAISDASGNLVEWRNSLAPEDPADRHIVPSSPASSPDILTTPSGLVMHSEENERSYVPSRGSNFLTPENNGFTILGHFRPTQDSSNNYGAILSNEHYLNTGFRLARRKNNSDKLYWWSGQSGGNLSLNSKEGLELNAPYQFTLSHNPNLNKASSLYLNAELQSSQNNAVILDNTRSLYLQFIGGHAGQPGEWSELMLVNRTLSFGERTLLQDYLLAKHQNTGPLAGDLDNNNIPDWQDVERAKSSNFDSPLDLDDDGTIDADEIAAGRDADLKDNPAVNLNVNVLSN